MNEPNRKYITNVIIDEKTGEPIDIADKLAEDYYQRTGTGKFDGDVKEYDGRYYDGLGRDITDKITGKR